MNVVVIAGLILAGVIHVMPIVGAFSADRLNGLYGIQIGDPALVVLMQHRAVLFGLLGALIIASAFLPNLRPVAVIGGVISILSFLVLAGAPGQQSAAIARIVYADWIALAALVPAASGLLLQRGAP